MRNLENVFTEALSSNGLFRLSGIAPQYIWLDIYLTDEFVLHTTTMGENTPRLADFVVYKRSPDSGNLGNKCGYS
jgi:hypothetical protein